MNDFIMIPKTEWNSFITEFKELRRIVDELKGVQSKESYFTTTEACKTYHVAPSTLFSHRKKGNLKSYRAGRIVRWPKSELEKFFNHKKAS